MLVRYRSSKRYRYYTYLLRSFLSKPFKILTILACLIPLRFRNQATNRYSRLSAGMQLCLVHLGAQRAIIAIRNDAHPRIPHIYFPLSSSNAAYGSINNALVHRTRACIINIAFPSRSSRYEARSRARPAHTLRWHLLWYVGDLSVRMANTLWKLFAGFSTPGKTRRGGGFFIFITGVLY